ncbi:MAG: sulfur oxidation c-type cytochrome SoxX [Geminicoccaceae bacterium]
MTIIMAEALVRTMKSVNIPGVLVALTVIGGFAALGHADELVSYEIVDDQAIEMSLTGAPGDPDKGREAFINRKLGNCLGCHAVTELDAEPFHGEVGPPLDGIGDIYDEGELRLRVVNAKIANPDTIMPGFYVSEDLHRVAEKFEGKTILTAEQVEDIVAYLVTLKES